MYWDISLQWTSKPSAISLGHPAPRTLKSKATTENKTLSCVGGAHGDNLRISQLYGLRGRILHADLDQTRPNHPPPAPQYDVVFVQRFVVDVGRAVEMEIQGPEHDLGRVAGGLLALHPLDSDL